MWVDIDVDADLDVGLEFDLIGRVMVVNFESRDKRNCTTSG